MPRCAGRTRFRHEFDWVGTSDPTGFLTLPAAIDWMARAGVPGGGGWPAIMAANHALALEGRDLLAAALGIDAPAPDSMLGSMAALPLAIPGVDDDAGADALAARARRRGWDPGPDRWLAGPARRGATACAPRILIRISAQRYNEPADYERLADALRRRAAARG